MKNYFIDIHKIASETTFSAGEVEQILHIILGNIQTSKGRHSKWSTRVEIITHLDYKTKKDLVLIYNVV